VQPRRSASEPAARSRSRSRKDTARQDQASMERPSAASSC
jgi:hypothetical protein